MKTASHWISPSLSPSYTDTNQEECSCWVELFPHNYKKISQSSVSSILYEHVDTLIVHVIICTHWVVNLYKNSNNILSSHLLSFVSFEFNLFSFFFFWCFFRFANLEWYFHITTTIRSALCLILFWINFFILIQFPLVWLCAALISIFSCSSYSPVHAINSIQTIRIH